jgi:uroporphyrinogen decarboxylase
MNKRDLMLSVIGETGHSDYVPAAFFLHFGTDFHTGQAAIDRHLEYFHYTGMDFVKVQYEKPFPPIPGIQKPSECRSMASIFTRNSST